MVKGVAAIGEPVYQVSAQESFEGVARRDSDRGRHGAGRGDVHQERAQENRGPNAVPEHKEAGERDSRGGPHRRRAGMNKGKLQTKLAGEEVNRQQNREDRQRF